MADALSFIPTNVLHKLYEKRKNAALEHGRKKINVELKKEAEYFGDIVIVPYMDNYDLIVLKTVAICEYGFLDGWVIFVEYAKPKPPPQNSMGAYGNNWGQRN